MIEIIPAIDIIGGECVRLTQGDYGRKTTYFKDPAEVAARYESIGLRRIHLVDLDGAKASAPANLKVLERVAARTGLDIQWGGGIKSADSLRAVLESGANRAICGSVAVTDPEAFAEWLAGFGPDHVILGADVRDGKVATHGWLRESELGVEELIDRFAPCGLNQVICTDISKDGMLQGPSFGMYGRLQTRYSVINITVSGGIGSLDDILKLNDMGLRSVIVGKAIYEGRITLKELETCLRNG
ncbi:1-(5-phosphoribosyl)-5-[(5-phosphoribosylamino)methylideneamino]imidazole-4-carboxamide isomerase [Gallalistipes aquisgranensis]|uniref:1-(5-phosphoribosyl)-5-[(5- phosphoribosylamino)methylideneamino]imidazole-4- carboxamide isomerase n=1 Tax=Gallalistipes aquisgranensis TaxID=2779358 RepID=UPI001CF8B9AE|nr:1-(5-phosphoribosyl)-5-[(5-phosphoribosylamino)methylideneamino]imidazole-4-carboxamide isomerase [Gallalistipes aquisgranensis]MBE5034239.1 1-(5-phosphoribosyl)-5-[(5-phosphoribosylamino)methylideneamino]imidazole-4-carboxamide isomerase [Gallalistipes aquisgranensis]